MLVSLCVVAYNEENTIQSLFEDIKMQTYLHKNIQIVLVDGNSEDRTREMMDKFSESHDFYGVKVIGNPKRKQASGWNKAITNADGDVIIRVDAHASIPPTFIQKNIDIIESGEMISGGKRPNILVNSTDWTNTLLMAESSMFGSSFAPYRKSEKKKYVNSMFHAAYKKEVFETAGLFNEDLGRTEDNELHYRMRKAGYNFCYSPEIISYQHVRSTLRKMIQQKFSNGYWIGRTAFICPRCLSMYHFVPLIFFLAIVLSILAVIKSTTFLILLLSLYFIVAVLMSITSIITEKKFTIEMCLLPLLFFLLHFSYGIGTFIGIITYPFNRKVSS
ncbi:glycosyltransferase [Enterococcus sp. JM4C]|uniref:glycosyltransferase family 2 protein n=1 Tax=Candidatus Enterococcus huntleyi TaxID=1857217 RepID=UPI00137B14B1|nr:glycosyltransferase family 2 protein [Enterococcus sp. JM4C]KAF1298824.1 glycosyltransferase [Enterococcus sp. JM4C]